MRSMSQTDYRRQPAPLLERVQGRIVGIGRIEESAVIDAYRRWAPVYDYTFGLVARQGAVIVRKTGELMNGERHLETPESARQPQPVRFRLAGALSRA